MKYHWKVTIFTGMVLGVLFVASRDKPIPSHGVIRRGPASVIHPQRQGKPLTIEEARAARIPVDQQSSRRHLRVRGFRNGPKPASIHVDINLSEYKGLHGMKLAVGMRAVKDSDYSPSLGDSVQSRSGMTFFKSIDPVHDNNLANVVFDKNNNKLYPLSPMIRVQGVTSETRNRIQQDGYLEYYYSAPTQFLYVKSTHEKLFSDYKELKNRGYKVSLEVLRGPHQSR